MIRAIEESRHKARMQCMPSAIRCDTSQHRRSNQRKIAEQVQSFVADKFIRESQGSFIQHSRFRQDDGIRERSAADQSAGLERFYLVIETERPSRRYELRVIPGSQFDFDVLIPDKRVCEVDVIFDRERFGRMDCDRLAILLKHERLCNADVVSRRIELSRTDSLNRLGERKCAAVENGNFEVVELYDRVIDAKTIQRGEQVFDGRDPDASLHERGRIRDARHGSNIRGKLKVVQVHTAEHDARPRDGWRNSHSDCLSGMEADPVEFHRRCNRVFPHRLPEIAIQWPSLRANIVKKLRAALEAELCTFVHNCLLNSTGRGGPDGSTEAVKRWTERAGRWVRR